jgi:DNA-binding LacI/PurR family transcriptional regulator
MALNWPAIDDRERGLRAALLGADPSVDCETVFSPSESFKVVQDAVRSFLKRRRVDAIAAANDPMGIAAMRVCEELKLKVPQDVRITGFNGFEAWQYATPTLTTVVSPAYELGQHAGELILERLKTGQFTKHPKIFPVQLLVGQSS